jgi:hypothetical protein
LGALKAHAENQFTVKGNNDDALVAESLSFFNDLYSVNNHFEVNYKFIEPSLTAQKLSIFREFLNSPQGVIYFGGMGNIAAVRARADNALVLFIAIESIQRLMMQRTSQAHLAEFVALQGVLAEFQGSNCIDRLGNILETIGTIHINAANNNNNVPVFLVPGLMGTFMHYSMKNELETRNKMALPTTQRMVSTINHLMQFGGVVNGASTAHNFRMTFSPAPPNFTATAFNKIPNLLLGPPPAFGVTPIITAVRNARQTHGNNIVAINANTQQQLNDAWQFIDEARWRTRHGRNDVAITDPAIQLLGNLIEFIL